MSELKGALPTVERGHNVVAILPPSPAAARPLVEALVGRLGGGVRGLMVVPPAAVNEWGRIAYAACHARGLRVEAALASTRALRELRSGTLDLLVAPPATVLELIERSALKVDQLGAVLLCQPETWAEHPVLSPLMQDLADDAQRIVIASDPARAEGLIDRYARKALLAGDTSPAAPTASVRAVSVRWANRASAIADLFQLLDPVTASIWISDEADRGAVLEAVQVDGSNVQVTSGDVPAADLVVAWDLPSAGRLAQLAEAGDTVLLVPPGTEDYVLRIAQTIRPFRLPGFMEQLAQMSADDRSQIRAELDAGEPSAAILALAPLFERHEPARVAAALYALWKRSRGAGPQAPRRPGVEDAPERDLVSLPADDSVPKAKIWVSVGKREGVTPADLVGALTRELKVDRTAIGRIELRDGFSLVELPAMDAERIAQALNGKSIRRVRVTARLDRGQSAPAGDRPSFRERKDRPVRRGGGRPRP